MHFIKIIGCHNMFHEKEEGCWTMKSRYYLTLDFLHKRKDCVENKTYFLEGFIPNGKSFVFNFNSDTCDKLRCGECKIDEIAKNENCLKNLAKYQDESRCIKLAYSMLKNGFVCERCAEVLLYKYDCGHYRFNNGQHRTCIASKLDMPIRVEMKNLKGLCDACLNHGKSKLTTL